jgi:hypothetical protein
MHLPSVFAELPTTRPGFANPGENSRWGFCHRIIPGESQRALGDSELLYGYTAQRILKDLGSNLHGAYLASASAAVFGQKCKALSRGVAHRHLWMPHPARISRAPPVGDPARARGEPVWLRRWALVGQRQTRHRRREALCSQASRRRQQQSYRCSLPFRLPPLPAFRSLRRQGFFQRKVDLKLASKRNTCPCHSFLGMAAPKNRCREWRADNRESPWHERRR